jgi:hypothetical protein
MDKTKHGPERRQENAMTEDQLTAMLAERVMGWRVTGGRFLMGDRRWEPRWRFQPAKKIADALQLLQKAASEEFSVRSDATGLFHARIRIDGKVGVAMEKSHARAVTFAIARAVGIDVRDQPGGGAADGI